MRIAISGPAGSGKTTVCMLVADRLGYERVLVGQIFRKMAQERGVDLDIFGRLAEEDETIDRELDQRMLAIARANEDIVLEGRLAGIMLKANGVPVLAVWITAPEDVRVKRVVGREGKPEEEVLREMRRRENSERKRYRAYYGVDIADTSPYDLCIDSNELSAEKIAGLIADRAKEEMARHAGEGEEGC